MQANGSHKTNSQAQSRLLLLLLTTTLVAAVFFSGSRRLDAPFLQGDEYLFIVNNDDVTGDRRPEALIERLVGIFRKVHGDLVQPLPILTYAIEWTVWGSDCAFYVRQNDVLLHAANALLLWSVLFAILSRGVADRGAVFWLSWVLALVWAVHPALVRAWAADMGRTHLLSGLFSLTAARLYIFYLDNRRTSLAVGVAVALVLAMLSKPVVGWFAVAFALECGWHGPRSALRSWRAWSVLGICAFFAALTMHTSRDAGLIENIGGALFGTPVTRSLLAATLYCKDTLWPFGLPIWYVPDIRTGWSHAGVWIGCAVAAMSALLIVGAMCRRRSRSLGAGLLLYWVLLAPVLGLVGARFSSAGDRYLYQPMFGLLVALGAGVLLMRRSRVRVATAVLAIVAIPFMIESRTFAGLTRDMLARGHRVVAQNPGDPRAAEMLGAAYNFCASHPEAGDGREAGEYEVLAISTLTHAADLAWAEPRFFRSDAARADFLRRLSYSLHNVDALPEAAAQARRAFELNPDSADNCTRWAHTSRAIGDWAGARQAYTALEECMPADPTQRTLRLTEFGDLLLHVLDDPRAAAPRYRLAIEDQTGPDRAYVGLARCEVLVGQGAEGYRLALEVNRRSPDRVDALLVMALFELKSHEIAGAHRTYRHILSRWPTNYEALRGFQEACANTGAWTDASFAWFGALEREPDNQAFASYLAWSVACANRPEANEIADRVLEARPDDPFACYAHMLLSLREAHVEDALQWVARAADGSPIPKARESLRADKTLQLMLDRGEIAPESLIGRAAIWKHLGNLDEAHRLAKQYLKAHPDSSAAHFARALAAE